jgi:hypothetical protein
MAATTSPALVDDVECAEPISPSAISADERIDPENSFGKDEAIMATASNVGAARNTVQTIPANAIRPAVKRECGCRPAEIQGKIPRSTVRQWLCLHEARQTKLVVICRQVGMWGK